MTVDPPGPLADLLAAAWDGDENGVRCALNRFTAPQAAHLHHALALIIKTQVDRRLSGTLREPGRPPIPGAVIHTPDGPIHPAQPLPPPPRTVIIHTPRAST